MVSLVVIMDLEYSRTGILERFANSEDKLGIFHNTFLDLLNNESSFLPIKVPSIGLNVISSNSKKFLLTYLST